MAFYQTPPALPHVLETDRVFRSTLLRTLGEDTYRSVLPELRKMAAVTMEELLPLQAADRLNEPRHEPWDAWGQRVDHIELTPLWKRCRVVAAESGLISIPHEAPLGALSRVLQFGLVYLFDTASDVYTCPLAMTDGAASTLRGVTLPEAVAARSHLMSRDPTFAWTSGQWMTERTGGSDVGLSETEARPLDDGTGRFALHGTKWFTSATTSEMALTLARPTGNPSGGKGLALFLVEVRDAQGRLNRLKINRLKDKMGTRKVPTAELDLDGTLALPIAGLSDGIRNMTPMLNVTRTWNSVCAVSTMRRGIALARDYAKKRVQFGARLSDKPLHQETLATLQAEFEGAVGLVFRTAALLGAVEQNIATEDEKKLLRVITPLTKLTTGKQAVACASEVLECFGGAGYIEDTGLPRLLRDAQVLSIWEGTTNVLSLDMLRGFAREDGFSAIAKEITRATSGTLRALEGCRLACRAALAKVETALMTDPVRIEAQARAIALTLGRTLELALLTEHAEWSAKHEGDMRPTYAAERLLLNGIDRLLPVWDSEATRALATDEVLRVDSADERAASSLA